jgi:Domain of unknown function (DUF222)/HNH endonuclease
MIEPMFELQASSQVGTALGHLAAAREQLSALDLTGLSGGQLLDLVAALEIDTRQRAAVTHALIAEVETRGVAAELGYTSTPVLLSERLRIGRWEAAQRVRVAADLAPRRAMSGPPLPARFPKVAAAVAAGTVCTRHAALICRTIAGLPEDALDQAEAVETMLIEHARVLNPDQLAVLARTVRACLDPDGVLASERDHERRRHAALTALPDGSGRLHAQLTGEATAVWQTILNTLARPGPDGEGGEPDGRSPGQRRHDALLDAGQRLLRAGTLPDAGGTPATVLLTLTLEQLEARTGLATTAHGGRISVPQALRIAAEADIVPVVVGDAGGVLSYGLTRRTASTGQRRALAARDRGCSFPGCDRPPDWCESHHVIAWADGGRTDLNNLTLMCGFHHREHRKRGWACQMTDGIPRWRPPRWIDSAQTPRRNTTHHIPVHLSTHRTIAAGTAASSHGTVSDIAYATA